MVEEDNRSSHCTETQHVDDWISEPKGRGGKKVKKKKKSCERRREKTKTKSEKQKKVVKLTSS
jgi:hypothetical protein